MVISYYIWVFSILTFLKFSNFAEINSTVEVKDGNIIGNISASQTVVLDEAIHNTNLTATKNPVLENDTLTYQSNSPDTPIPYNNISNEQKIIVGNTESTDKLNGTLDTGQSPESSKSGNITDSASNNDEMPTFVAYRQKLEKESKEKKEKADSIPSSPTMIVKDDNKPIKSQSESTNSKSATRDSADPVGMVAPATQDTKSSANVEKTDSKSGGSRPGTDEQKSDARTASLTKKLLKNNVAAKECGAKMLEVSKQMTNADHVLNSNKDEYLNVPCSLPEKWFVVEACEPVQIRSIQIANFEMFSSRPKTFKVFSSDRYPAKHWYNLGLFRAHDEKGIQTFTISDSNMVKYIKFEMVDHYGNEHYCPLTFVRILGNVVIDEMDEDSEDAQSLGDDDSPIDNHSESNSESNSDGILTKAKDMLVKMVNGIGGAKKPDHSSSVELSNTGVYPNDASKSSQASAESPCYFIDFLTSDPLVDCESTISIFERFLVWERRVQLIGQSSLEARIVAEPFPLQIRADYFAVFQSVSSSRFDFGRLHRSFCNLTALSSRDLCAQRPWLGLGAVFKCCESRSRRAPRCSQPTLPNITAAISSQSPGPPLSTASSVDHPDLGAPAKVDVPTKPVSAANENEQPYVDMAARPPLNETVREDSFASTNADRDATGEEQASRDTRAANRTVPASGAAGSGVSRDTETSETVATDGQGWAGEKLPTGAGSNAWNQAFMRIKNMAKQLELNVSISMQYLEELSQNYKSQTERLKRSQQQTAEELSALEHALLQHRREARDAIGRLARQLQGLAFKLRFGFSPSSQRASDWRNRSSSDSSELPELLELRCADLLVADDLFVPTWTDSAWLPVLLSTVTSVLCNVLVLALFYSRVRPRLESAPPDRAAPGSPGSTTTTTTSSTTFPAVHMSDIDRQLLEFSFVEDLSRASPSRSCGDISKAAMLPRYPVVLPPRGVNLSFVESRTLSEDKRRRGSSQFHPQLGPHLYTVLPSLNFVTPSKDRKKKRKK